MRLIIQSKKIPGTEHIIPIYEFGYAAIQSIMYQKWYNNADSTVVLHTSTNFRDIPDSEWWYGNLNYLSDDDIPIGSVEFVESWLWQKAEIKPKPLNIPKELWNFVKRDIVIDTVSDKYVGWFRKSVDIIKHSDNGWLQDADVSDNSLWLLSTPIPNILSEWRVFVFNGEVKGIKCYAGDEWILPDKTYIQSIVKSYDKSVYTLDVAVYDDTELNGHKTTTGTDIIELHDFFSCGLYGFDDYRILPQMWRRAIHDILQELFTVL